MQALTTEQVASWRPDGSLTPFPLLSESERQECLAGLGRYEAWLGEPVNAAADIKWRTMPYLLMPWAARLARDARILDRVEALLGSDLLIRHRRARTRHLALSRHLLRAGGSARRVVGFEGTRWRLRSLRSGAGTKELRDRQAIRPARGSRSNVPDKEGIMKSRHFLSGCVLAVSAFTCLGTSPVMAQSAERGKYLVVIAGCNDCHTPGYLLAEGKTPEALWLTGDSFGWRGPWGTTYPPNLRTVAMALTEDQWVLMAKSLKARPPMPWFNLNAMEEVDLRSIYRYIRKLGPGGQAAPAFVPPEQEPNPPYAVFPAPPPQ